MATRTYRNDEKARAQAWKSTTAALPDAARAAGPYRLGGPTYPYCLPVEHTRLNLLPDVRERALGLFAELGIKWHEGIAGGPSSHLLDSQVQCTNALTAMVDDPSLVRAAFGGAVDIAEVLSIEPGRWLTFEYIGATNYFNEGRNGIRTRGANCTSVDAAFSYRTGTGETELALVEWKYTEEYRRARPPDSAADRTRSRRYASAYADGPLRTDLLDFDMLLDDPLYQLMRQQLLADQLERDPAVPATTVRVLHVLPPANYDYQASLVRDSHRRLGSTVDEVWSKLLRRPDRFAHVDPQVFAQPAVTSAEYVARYGTPTD